MPALFPRLLRVSGTLVHLREHVINQSRLCAPTPQEPVGVAVTRTQQRIHVDQQVASVCYSPVPPDHLRIRVGIRERECIHRVLVAQRVGEGRCEEACVGAGGQLLAWPSERRGVLLVVLCPVLGLACRDQVGGGGSDALRAVFRLRHEDDGQADHQDDDRDQGGGGQAGDKRGEHGHDCARSCRAQQACSFTDEAGASPM